MGDNLKEGVKKQDSTWQKIKNFLHYVCTVIMYSICLIMIIIFLAFIINFIDQKKNLSKGQQRPALFSGFTIVSPSMVPSINVLDIVITKRIDNPEDIKKNDIITFTSTDYRYSGVTVTHRVINIEKTSDGKYLFTTKGDANNTKDASRINFNDIYGKVLFRIPKVGYIQYFLSNFLGWIIIIIIPAVGIIGYDIFKLIKTVKNNPKNKKNQIKSKQNDAKSLKGLNKNKEEKEQGVENNSKNLLGLNKNKTKKEEKTRRRFK